MSLRNTILAAACLGTAAPLVAGWRRFGWAWPISHGLLAAAVVRRNSAIFGPVVRRFATEQPEVWLTIDDGPSERDTPEILRLLRGHSARAGFFCIGRRVAMHRRLVRRMVDEGHEVGNHTDSHPSATFWALPPWRMEREICRGAEAIRCATGSLPRYFRAPVGMINPFVHPVLDAVGELAVGWSASGLDGINARGREVANRLLAGVRPGSILVLHEGGAAGRIETLEMVLGGLQGRGFRCVIPDSSQFFAA